MRQSRAFWLGFGFLCGACLLSVVNPCVGLFSLFYLILAFIVLVSYLVMRSHARALREGRASAGRSRDAMLRTTRIMSRALFGMAAVFLVLIAVATLTLTMLGLDPEVGGRVMFPVQLAPFDAAFDLWAISAVMGIASAVALVTAGGDVRRWPGGVS